MNRTSLVQTNSVQSQFLALTRDRDALRIAIETTDRDRRTVEKQLQELHEAHRTLTEQVREAHGNMSCFNGKRALLNEEYTRLNRQLERERQTLEGSLKQVGKAEDELKTKRRAYCQEMKGLSENLEQLLRQFESSRLQALVSSETVKRLKEVWQQKREKVADAEKIEARLDDAIGLLQEAIEKLNKEVISNKKLKQQVEAVRQQILSKGEASINEQQLLAMEESWKEENWVRSKSGVDNGTYGGNVNVLVSDAVHLDLFYGAENANVMIEATEFRGQDSLRPSQDKDQDCGMEDTTEELNGSVLHQDEDVMCDKNGFEKEYHDAGMNQ